MMFTNTFLGSLNPSNLRFFGSNSSFRVISIHSYSSSNWSSHQSRYSPILFTIPTPDFKNKKKSYCFYFFYPYNSQQGDPAGIA